jgi:hypothetical protein
MRQSAVRTQQELLNYNHLPCTFINKHEIFNLQRVITVQIAAVVPYSQIVSSCFILSLITIKLLMNKSHACNCSKQQAPLNRLRLHHHLHASILLNNFLSCTMDRENLSSFIIAGQHGAKIVLVFA